jgi:hypothetical protein
MHQSVTHVKLVVMDQHQDKDHVYHVLLVKPCQGLVQVNVKNVQVDKHRELQVNHRVGIVLLAHIHQVKDDPIAYCVHWDEVNHVFDCSITRPVSRKDIMVWCQWIGNGSSECIECSTGSVASVQGLTGCSLCLPGFQMSSTGQPACTPCDSGYYTAGYGTIQCSQCDEGRYSEKINEIGAQACSLCDFGTYIDVKGQSKCTSCASGRSSSALGAQICGECQSGYFQGSTGQSFCNQCDVGKYASTTGRTECLPCAAGTYSYQNGTLTCTPVTIITPQWMICCCCSVPLLSLAPILVVSNWAGSSRHPNYIM